MAAFGPKKNRATLRVNLKREKKGDFLKIFWARGPLFGVFINRLTMLVLI